MTRAPIPPELRARLHARFPKSPQWAPTGEASPAPWEIIHAALVRGQAGGLNTRQLASGIYAALVSHGLMDGGRA